MYYFIPELDNLDIGEMARSGITELNSIALEMLTSRSHRICFMHAK